MRQQLKRTIIQLRTMEQILFIQMLQAPVLHGRIQVNMTSLFSLQFREQAHIQQTAISHLTHQVALIPELTMPLSII